MSESTCSVNYRVTKDCYLRIYLSNPRLIATLRRDAVNRVGLEPAFGFLHEPSHSRTSQGLVYDLQEPFRWLCDVTVVEAFESGVVDLKDFYFMGDDYRYHIEVDAKRRFLELLKDRFNTGAEYKDKSWKWNTVILTKSHELARFLLGRTPSLNLTDPNPNLGSRE
jgi:CRISPR-associated protein Cas1